MNNEFNFIIESASGVHSGNCVLGGGATKKEAWEDAFGPKPWGPFARKSAKKAWCTDQREANTADELSE